MTDNDMPNFSGNGNTTAPAKAVDDMPSFGGQAGGEQPKESPPKATAKGLQPHQKRLLTYAGGVLAVLVGIVLLFQAVSFIRASIAKSRMTQQLEHISQVEIPAERERYRKNLDQWQTLVKKEFAANVPAYQHYLMPAQWQAHQLLLQTVDSRLTFVAGRVQDSLKSEDVGQLQAALDLWKGWRAEFVLEAERHAEDEERRVQAQLAQLRPAAKAETVPLPAALPPPPEEVIQPRSPVTGNIEPLTPEQQEQQRRVIRQQALAAGQLGREMARKEAEQQANQPKKQQQLSKEEKYLLELQKQMEGSK